MNKCRIEHNGRYLVVTMPDGTVIPAQTSLYFEDVVGEKPSNTILATIELEVDISNLKDDENFRLIAIENRKLQKEIDELKQKAKDRLPKNIFKRIFK